MYNHHIDNDDSGEHMNGAPHFVKVHSSLGYAGGLWKVKARDTRHYTVENVQTKDKVTLFIGHTYEDFETKRASFEARKAFADTLGNRLRKGGKGKR